MEVYVNTIATSLWQSWNIFISSVFSRIALDLFPLVDAILLTTVWLALAGLVNWVVLHERPTGGAQTLVTAISTAYRSISPTLRSDIWFFLVLALGSYLSFSSVIAIPSLQEADTQEKLKPEDLKARLETVPMKDPEFEIQFAIREPFFIATGAAKKPQISRVAETSAPSISTTETTPDTKVSAPDDTVVVPSDAGTPPWLTFLAKDYNRKIMDFRAKFVELRENFRTDQHKLIDLATQTFEISDRGRKGVRESQQHFLNIVLWYRHWWTQQAAQIRECRAAMNRFTSTTNSTVDSLAALQGYSALSSDILKALNEQEREVVRSCENRTNDYQIPARENFGGYLGIFGSAASWLLKTESLSLVLIAGLLGFGLLGAACSTFIRNVGARNTADPLVPNLSSVVIRGGSAAILIFLGVYAGLAVFSATTASPNPYALLFTCLVASVFSEDAWAWGADKFRSELARGKSSQSPEKTQEQLVSGPYEQGSPASR